MIGAGQFEIAPPPGLNDSILFSDSGGLDTIAHGVRRDGLAAYEAPMMEVFVALVRHAPGLVLDVGANTGLFSLVAAAANPLATVCSFEPLDSVRALLDANIALNPRLSPRIAVQPFALSHTNGSMRFFEHINDQGLIPTSSSLEQEHAGYHGDFIERVIETRTLDDWAPRLNPPITLMKVDVEGHEHAVIEGGRRVLGAQRPFVTIEVLAPAEKDGLNRFLVEAGYLDLVMVPGLLRQCETIRFHPDGWNHLLCPAEKAARLFPLCRQIGLELQLA